MWVIFIKGLMLYNYVNWDILDSTWEVIFTIRIKYVLDSVKTFPPVSFLQHFMKSLQARSMFIRVMISINDHLFVIPSYQARAMWIAHHFFCSFHNNTSYIFHTCNFLLSGICILLGQVNKPSSRLWSVATNTSVFLTVLPYQNSYMYHGHI